MFNLVLTFSLWLMDEKGLDMMKCQILAKLCAGAMKVADIYWSYFLWVELSGMPQQLVEWCWTSGPNACGGCAFSDADGDRCDCMTASEKASDCSGVDFSPAQWGDGDESHHCYPPVEHKLCPEFSSGALLTSQDCLDEFGPWTLAINMVLYLMIGGVALDFLNGLASWKGGWRSRTILYVLCTVEDVLTMVFDIVFAYILAHAGSGHTFGSAENYMCLHTVTPVVVPPLAPPPPSPPLPPLYVCDCSCHANNYVPDLRDTPVTDCWILNIGYDQPCCNGLPPPAPSPPPAPPSPPGTQPTKTVCENTCGDGATYGGFAASDGACDDGGPGAEAVSSYCSIGTDCDNPRLTRCPHACCLRCLMPTDQHALCVLQVTTAARAWFRMSTIPRKNMCARACLPPASPPSHPFHPSPSGGRHRPRRLHRHRPVCTQHVFPVTGLSGRLLLQEEEAGSRSIQQHQHSFLRPSQGLRWATPIWKQLNLEDGSQDVKRDRLR